MKITVILCSCLLW